MTTSRPWTRQELQEIGDTVEAVILGGPRKYTADEVVAPVGADHQHVVSLWRAMGFAAPADDDRAYTDYDVEALRRVDEWGAVAGVGPEAAGAITRVIAQSFAQMASWEGELAVDTFVEGAKTSDSTAALMTFSERLLPMLERSHNYLWRRQMAAYIARRIAVAQEERLRTSEVAVGFADIAGYTALTRDASERDLRRLLEAFESVVTDARRWRQRTRRENDW